MFWKTVDNIHECVERTDLAEEYTEEDSKKDLAIVYVQTGVKLVKLYAPAVILGVISITSMVASNRILRKRNVALAAAYATVSESYKKYRSRIVDKFGEDTDKEIVYGVTTQTTHETVTDDDGREITVEKNKKTVGSVISPYARLFDEYNPNWEKDSDYNYMYLQSVQSWANSVLQSRGYLFLNEVYDKLGITKTKAGQIVGWVYAPDNPKHNGDNYIDFGLNSKAASDFLDGCEPSIWLDFNVDGNIIDCVQEEDFYE